jgi:hypothetical protein
MEGTLPVVLLVAREGRKRSAISCFTVVTHGFRGSELKLMIGLELHVVLLRRATCRICKRDVIALMKVV